MTPFTDEDQQALNDLTYRKAVADWTSREDARKARLSLLSDLASAFTADTVRPIVEAASKCRPLLADSDPQTAEMLSNIETVMGFSGFQIVSLIERLSTAEPEPGAPVAPSDASSAPVDDAERSTT